MSISESGGEGPSFGCPAPSGYDPGQVIAEGDSALLAAFAVNDEGAAHQVIDEVVSVDSRDLATSQPGLTG